MRVDDPRAGLCRKIRPDRRDPAGLDQEVGRSGAIQHARLADQRGFGLQDGSLTSRSLSKNMRQYAQAGMITICSE